MEGVRSLMSKFIRILLNYLLCTFKQKSPMIVLRVSDNLAFKDMDKKSQHSRGVVLKRTKRFMEGSLYATQHCDDHN